MEMLAKVVEVPKTPDSFRVAAEYEKAAAYKETGRWMNLN
jgi:hypothetical protein